MAVRNVTLVAGLSGFGKSTFALRYLVNADLAIRFLFDPECGEFDPSKGEFASRLGLTPADTGYALHFALCNYWVAFDPHGIFTGRLKEAFEFYCDWSWEKSALIPGEKILVVDEIWQYCSPHSIPQELQTIVQSGRKRGLRLMCLTQEPNRLNSSILNGMSEMVCFKLQSGPALDKAEEMGFDRAEIASLAPLHFVARNLDSGGELRGAITL